MVRDRSHIKLRFAGRIEVENEEEGVGESKSGPAILN